MRIHALVAIALAFPVYVGSVVVFAKANASSGVERPIPATLHGVYRGTPTSGLAWAAFGYGDTYALWSAAPACHDPESAPAMCSETGTFVLAPSGKSLVLDDGKTKHLIYVEPGEVSTTRELLTFSFVGDPPNRFGGRFADCRELILALGPSAVPDSIQNLMCIK